MALGGLLFERPAPELSARVEGVELEGECPSLGVIVVSLKDVTSGSVSPLVHWFLDDTGLHVRKESALPRPEVALDRNHSWHF